VRFGDTDDPATDSRSSPNLSRSLSLAMRSFVSREKEKERERERVSAP